MRRGNWKSRAWKLLLPAVLLSAVAGFWLAGPGRLQYHLWRARHALAKRDAEQALARLKSAERLDARCGDTQFWMARAYRKLGEVGQVRVHLEGASKLGYSIDRLEREELLLLAQGGQFAPGDPRIIGLLADPREEGTEIYEALVRGFIESHHLGPAASLLDTWESESPDCAQAHVLRGLVWARQNEWPRAAASLRKALELAPKRYDVRLQLARALREQYQYREAVKHYGLCLAKEEEPEALLGLGSCLQGLGELQEARKVFARLLEKVPDHYEGLLAAGGLELSVGAAPEALGWLERAVVERPYEFNVRYDLAKALLYSGQKERARGHFQFASGAQVVALRLENLMRRISTDPHNAELRRDIGATLVAHGQSAVGLIWLRSALALQPNHRPTHLNLADYYSQQGDGELAAEHRRLAGVSAY